MPSYLTGLLGGFQSRKAEIEQQNLDEAHAAQQREGKVYEALINSPDPEIKSLAITGLLHSAQPGTRKSGLSGWMGEMQQSPYLGRIQALVNQPVTTQEPTYSLPSTSTTGYMTEQPGVKGSMAQPEGSATEVGGPPPATLEPGPAPERNVTTTPVAPVQTGTQTGTQAVTRPRQVFESADEAARKLKVATASGDVEGEVAGFKAVGYTEEQAREIVKAQRLRRAGAGAQVQSIPGETVDPQTGIATPAFGVFDRTPGSPTYGQYLHPQTQQPLPNFRPKSATSQMSYGTAVETASRELFGKNFKDLTQAEQAQVQQKVDQNIRTGSTARAEGTNDAFLDKYIGVANSLRYPGTTATTTYRELQQRIPQTPEEIQRAYGTGQLEQTVDEILPLINRVFPDVGPGVAGTIKTFFNLGAQSLSRTEDYTQLNAAIASTMAAIVRANGVTQRLNQRELDLAQQQMIETDVFHKFDTRGSALAKLEILKALISRVQGATPTSTAPGTPPPAPGAPPAAGGAPPAPAAAAPAGPQAQTGAPPPPFTAQAIRPTRTGAPAPQSATPVARPGAGPGPEWQMINGRLYHNGQPY